jgi:hypothetical protein
MRDGIGARSDGTAGPPASPRVRARVLLLDMFVIASKCCGLLRRKLADEYESQVRFDETGWGSMRKLETMNMGYETEEKEKTSIKVLTKKNMAAHMLSLIGMELSMRRQDAPLRPG